MSQATLVIQETPLDAIRLHPRNLRRQVGDVAEMAQSMRERGVLEPLIVAPGLDEEAGVVLSLSALIDSIAGAPVPHRVSSHHLKR